MSWIERYKPKWVVEKREAEELVERWSKDWIGKRLDKAYVAWFEADDSWYEDLPIILFIGGDSIEICWQKFDSLSITKNQIDITNCISINKKIPYKENAHPALHEVVGKKILNVKLGMSSMTLEDKEIPMINSVDFVFEDSFISIFNALDENGLSNMPQND